MDKTKIEWTDSTWNPVTGCDFVSSGCLNCYAERMAARLTAMGNVRYRNGFQVTIHQDLFDLPLQWKESRLIFVNSMSDLFHDDVPLAAIQRIFETMNKACQHKFQILTKRESRLLDVGHLLNWTPNIWMGVTVEHQENAGRINALREIPAAVRFISFEPLLSAISPSVSLRSIDWAIIGGESGPGSRPMEQEWVGGIRDICRRDNAAFFFKQWGGKNKKAAGREFEGRTWDEMPQPRFVREPART